MNGILEFPNGKVVLYEDNRPNRARTAALRARLAEIAPALVADNLGDVAAALKTTFEVMPSQSANGPAKSRAYLEELSDLDAGAVIVVLRRFVRGEIDRNSEFAPTISEIRKQVALLTASLDRERAKIEKVLAFWDRAERGDATVEVIPSKKVEG